MLSGPEADLPTALAEPASGDPAKRRASPRPTTAQTSTFPPQVSRPVATVYRLGRSATQRLYESVSGGVRSWPEPAVGLIPTRNDSVAQETP